MSLKQLRSTTRRGLFAIFIALTSIALASCTGQSQSAVADHPVQSHLAEWQKGVWIQPGGSYTIYTDTHYFVVMASGDPDSPNIYCGASQVRYCSGGMARKQVVRVRQLPGGDMNTFNESVFEEGGKEDLLVIDTTLFKPDVCNIVDGVIYDSITEETDDYILLSTCNGDKEKIYKNGVSVYMPKDGGEFYSYRVETFN